MAQNDGRREVVNDPLAITGREVRPDRSLALSGVRSPNNGGPQGAGDAARAMSAAAAQLEGAFSDHIERKKDDWIAEGKMAYMSGKTEADLIASGNRFTHQGWLQLKVRDDVNKWFMDEANAIDSGADRDDPAGYQERIAKSRTEYLNSLKDPYAKKVAVAAFEEFSPKLVQSQFAKNNEFQRGQRINGFSDLLSSTSATSPSKSVVDPNGPLKLTNMPVLPVMQVSERDRDIGIRTMLGEAAGEGDTGLAAVAHVIRNRAVDEEGRWPKSITGVALQEKQFSAWNSGAGGNNPGKWVKGSARYEQAGKIFDAVMSGRHVDPTGGATHYYSPSGMTALVQGGSQGNLIPRWLQAEKKRAGGVIKIGGHIFTGKARMPAVARLAGGKLPDQIAERMPDPVTTGSTGKLTPEQQMAVKPGLVWDENSKSYVPAADGVVQDVNTAPAEQEAAVTGIEQPGTANEIQDLIRNYGGLNAADKASALSTRMANDLANGDDTLFRDGGGYAMLYELGATPDEVEAVRNAERKFRDHELDQFDADDEKWRADIIAQAESGKSTMDSILAQIDKREEAGLISDSAAQSLARQAISDLKAAGVKVLDGDLDYQQQIGTLYQRVQNDELTFEEAGAEAQRIGKQFGADEKEVNSVIGQVFSIDQQRKNAIRSEAKQTFEKRQKVAQAQAEVDAALARGTGLATVSGTVEGFDKQKYGIQKIKEKHVRNMQDELKRGVPQDEALRNMTVNAHVELQKHGVVDEQTQAQLVGPVLGPIVGPDGKVDKAALEAFDTYQMLKGAPEITDGYLAKLVDNQDARMLLQTAYTLDAGNMSGARALQRAQEILSDPLRDKNRSIDKTPVWRADLRKKVREVIDGKQDVGFFERLGGAQGANPEEKARSMNGKDRAETYVLNRAEGYFLQNEQISPDVALDMAKADLENNSTIIAGNLIISPDGQNLSERMGLQQFGANAPDAAVSEFLNEFGSDLFLHEDASLGSEWDVRMQSKASQLADQTTYSIGTGMAMGIPNLFGSTPRPKQPPINVTYNPVNNQFTFTLYKDAEKGELLFGMEETVNADEIGAWYMKKQQEPSIGTNFWEGLYGAIGDAGKGTRKGQNRIDAGRTIRETIQPK